MNAVQFSFDLPVMQVGQTIITLGTLLLLAAGLLCLLVIFMHLLSRRAVKKQAAEKLESERLADQRARDMEAKFSEILSTQAQMQGRMATIADVFGSRQNEINKTIGERLDGMSQRLGTTISEQTKSTHENLARLQERLAVIPHGGGHCRRSADKCLCLSTDAFQWQPARLPCLYAQ